MKMAQLFDFMDLWCNYICPSTAKCAFFSMYNSVKFNWNGFSMGFYGHSELFNKISIFYKCVHVFVSFSHSLFFLESRKVHVLCTFCTLFDTKIIVLCILKTVLNQEKLFTSTNSVKVKKRLNELKTVLFSSWQVYFSLGRWL